MADQQQQNGGDGGDAAPVAGAANSSDNDQRSIVLTGFGAVRMVKVQRRPVVKPIEGEVLIHVKAWSVI